MTNNQPDRLNPLDRIEAIVAANASAIAELRSSQTNTDRQILNNTANLEVLRESQTRLQELQIEMGQTQAQLGRTQEQIGGLQEVLAQNLIELRAGQERQERILDYLVRRNGN